MPIVILCALLSQASCTPKNSNQSNAGNSSSADKSLGAAVDPARARVFLEQGKELYKKDEDQQAAEAFQKAINLDPSLAEAHFRLGLAYDALDQKHEAEDAYKKAIEPYKKYLSANPKDAEGFYNLGQTYAGEEAKEGVKRIKTGKEYAEDQLKKKQDEEKKKQQQEQNPPGSTPSES